MPPPLHHPDTSPLPAPATRRYPHHMEDNRTSAIDLLARAQWLVAAAHRVNDGPGAARWRRLFPRYAKKHRSVAATCQTSYKTMSENNLAQLRGDKKQPHSCMVERVECSLRPVAAPLPRRRGRQPEANRPLRQDHVRGAFRRAALARRPPADHRRHLQPLSHGGPQRPGPAPGARRVRSRAGCGPQQRRLFLTGAKTGSNAFVSGNENSSYDYDAEINLAGRETT